VRSGRGDAYASGRGAPGARQPATFDPLARLGETRRASAHAWVNVNLVSALIATAPEHLIARHPVACAARDR
jgi:hypothetical protein